MALNQAVLQALRAMPMNDLLALNSLVIQEISIKRDGARNQAKAQFRPGDMVQFQRRGADQWAKPIIVQIEKIGPKNLIGWEIDDKGSKTLNRWRVAPTLCTKVEL